MITSQEKQIVQSTFVKVTLVSNQAGEWFYKRLFELDPDIRPLFSNVNIHIQSTKLLQMIAIAVTGLDDMDALNVTMRNLGNRHIAYGVKREQYAMVGQALMSALAHVLGSEFTEEAEAAWQHVYDALANMAIEGNYEPSQSILPKTNL